MDLGKEKEFHRKIAGARAWEKERRESIQKYMSEAKQILLDGGFTEDKVSVKIQKREEGVARDIIKEARKGYRAVAVGRRGRSKLKEMILGNTSTKLLEKLSFAPLLLIGKEATPERIIVAFDGSDNAERALHCVGNVIGGSDTQVTLLHVFRGEDEDFVEEITDEMNKRFGEAVRNLEKSGIKSELIKRLILTGVESRAGAIVDEARKRGCGTIVVGRRGISQVQDFAIGRVSNKVAYLAKGLAVWVVN
jgi:nucleotide-binding universal stress UspA family protein